MALGMVTQLPEEDQSSISRKQMLARLDVCMGVRERQGVAPATADAEQGAATPHVCICVR